jgi:hypothetical protein
MHAIGGSLYFLYQILGSVWGIVIVLRIELMKCESVAKLKILSQVINFLDRIFIQIHRKHRYNNMFWSKGPSSGNLYIQNY